MQSRQQDTRKHRLSIRKKLIKMGYYPYPQDGKRSHSTLYALKEKHDILVIVAGRIKALRGHGSIRFLDIEDESGRIQLVVSKKDVTNFDLLDDIAVGDFFRARGKRFITKAGEESVRVNEFDLLSKALRRIPDGWGENKLKDEETRYRNRSVDLAIYPERKEIFIKRSKIIASVRKTLVDEGYVEVETPTLQPLYGGANARPFVTHINVWDMQMFLRISPELYLKYLIMGGFDKVFEITKNFRNEGVDRTHNPEFTMMECYSAYSDYHNMMDLTEKIYKNAAKDTLGTTKIEYQGVLIDLGKKWRRLTMKDAIKEYLDITVDELSDSNLHKAIQDCGLEYEGEWVRGLGIAKLFEAVEDQLVQPTFIIDFPRETTSLCKPHRNDSSLIERFEPYICGWEVGNAYTELNDPVLQRQFWEEERADDPEAHQLDEDFIRAMEYGMPPTGGLGLGIDRLVMILTNQTKIRDVILFPTMKPPK